MLLTRIGRHCNHAFRCGQTSRGGGVVRLTMPVGLANERPRFRMHGSLSGDTL